MKKRRVTVHIRRNTANFSMCGRAMSDLALTYEAARHHPVGKDEVGVICGSCSRLWMKLERR